MRFVLIEGGDIYNPRRAGVQPLLLAGSKIVKLGPVETTALPFLGLVASDLRPWFWAFGAFEIVVALLTSTRPHFAEDEYGYAADTGAAYGAGSYDKDVAMTGRNTTIAEGDRDARYGVTNTTYTGETRTGTAEQQPLPDDAGHIRRWGQHLPKQGVGRHEQASQGHAGLYWRG